MNRKRVLVAHPRVTGSGGGNAVAAWVLQALRERFDVSLATLQAPDYADLNRNWGTSLRPGDVRVHVAPRRYTRLLRSLPTPGALLETCLTMRLARALDERRRYDVLLGTQNEADFGRRGITYVHHPWVYLPRPEDEMRWYHRIPGTLTAYRAICQAISRGSNEGLRRNLSLANSSFIAGRIRAVHGIDSTVVFPPVTSEFPERRWEDRVDAVVALGRLNGSKRWEMAVAVVDELRRRGRAVELTLIGHEDDRDYQARLVALAASRPWFRIRTNLSRDELKAEVVRHRYAIHTMENEHFGMAPAELLRAGCLLFAHDSGGPVEIVGGEKRLLFADVADAAEKLEQALSDPRQAADLRRHLAARRALFSTETFCAAMCRIVEDFA
jgi:glycosyltransferase involved in cell wall biosynthesis